MFHSLESQKIEMEQIEFLMRALTKPEWTGDWLGYCRTYLNRYGITNEVEVLSIAGNLEQVVKKMIAEEREKVLLLAESAREAGAKSEREHIAKEVEGKIAELQKHINVCTFTVCRDRYIDQITNLSDILAKLKTNQ